MSPRLAPLLLLGLAACAPAAPPAPPNVLLVVIDTLRADRLGCYGYGRPTSPRLDAFAERAIVFENPCTSAPWTMPAVAALVTGRAPAELGVGRRAVPIPPEVPTLAETLADAGYATAGIVSHLFVGSEFGFQRGFGQWNQEHARGHDYVSSPAVTDLAIESLASLAAARRAQGTPFLLFVHYFDPHYDYVPQDYPELVRPSEGTLKSAHDNIAKLRRRAAAGRYGPEDVRYLNDLYDSEVRFTDHHLGRLLDALSSEGLFDETLVVVTADHGEALMDRPDRWIGHTRTLFEELMRVPLIVKPAGVATPRRIATPVSTREVFPTVLRAAGLETDATSAPPTLLPEPSPGPRFAATYRDVELQMVREGPWKLVHDRPSGRNWLYHLTLDPKEERDVADEHPEVLARLEKARTGWHDPRHAALLERDAEPPALDEEQQRRLEALGY